MVADLIEAKPKRQSHRDELRQSVHADALIMGIRASARKHGVNEDTACTWAHRFKWKLPEVLKDFRLKMSRKGTAQSVESTQKAHAYLDHLSASIDEHGEQSRLYLSAATLQASHTLAAAGGKTDGERVPYAGLLNVSRSGDTVHGWQAQRTAGPTVQIANVVMPTPEEKAERQAMFAKLEEITRRLATPAAE